MFLILGLSFVQLSVIQKKYSILLIPLGWLLIIYLILREFLKIDFNININIIKLDPIKKQKIKIISLCLLFFVTFFAFAVLMFYVVFDSGNVYGKISLIIGGIIFGFVSLISLYAAATFLFGLTDIINKIKKKNILIIYFIFSSLFGLLFLTAGLGNALNFGKINEEYCEIQGRFIGYQLDDSKNDKDSKYYLIYSYEVNGVEYKISTNYSTSFVPELRKRGNNSI